MPYYVYRKWIDTCADCDRHVSFDGHRVCTNPEVVVYPHADGKDGIAYIVPEPSDGETLAELCYERYGEDGVPPWCPFLDYPTMLGAPERSLFSVVED